jgi:hypothetical protein
LKAFTYTITPSGNVRYHAPEGLKDDCVISLGLAALGLKYTSPPQRGPVSYLFDPPISRYDPLDEIRRNPRYFFY